MNCYLYEACQNTFLITEQENRRLEYLKVIKNEKIDGLIIYKNNPLEMKIYNRDGSVASMCGNGLRCFLLYGYEKGYLGKGFNEVKTLSGPVKTEIVSSSPFQCRIYIKPNVCYQIKKEVFFLDGEMMFLYMAYVGTLSHIVLYKTGLDKEKVIKRIKGNVVKENVGNISFVKLNSSKEMEVLTYERGVGYTASCGTGNCAAFYVFYTLHLIQNNVRVINKGGIMDLSYENNCVVITSGANICKSID